MFDSIYSESVTAAQFFFMAGVSLATGMLYSWLMSFRLRSKGRFYAVIAIIPFAVASIVTFVKGNIGAGAQGTSDEIAAILIAMCGGIAFGMGYVAYGVMIILGLALLYFLVAGLPIFRHRKQSEDQLLRITIPEDLEYVHTFDEIFAKYLKDVESVGAKTTGMGSMYKLSFRIRLNDQTEEKAFIDELRTKNGNLEIALTPYAEAQAQL